ncbi:MAG: hypothetical protein AAGG51_23115 [Cyanobacteria bacterium P01_G01_bin.54]
MDSFWVEDSEVYFPDALTQLDLALLYWELVEPEQAQQLLEIALGRSVLFGVHAGAQERDEFVDYLIKTEQFEEAIRLSWTIERPRSRLDLLIRLIEKALIVGEDKWAINAAYSMQYIPAYHRYQIDQTAPLEQHLTELSQFLVEQGQYDRAAQRVERWQGEQQEWQERISLESERWLASMDCFQQVSSH